MGGKLHFAPVKNPRRVLDIGTGTGIWAIEFGLSTVVLLRVILTELRRGAPGGRYARQ